MKFLETHFDDYIKKDGKIVIDSLSDPSQAIITLQNKVYDVVVCDYLMPSMDGLELLRKIKKDERARNGNSWS